MEHLAVNAMGRARVEVIDGRKHIVAPLSLIVPGTLAGSKGALNYPEDEVAKGPERWDKVPLVVYHPVVDNKPVSVQHPGILEKSGIGFTRNAGFKDKLHAEGCFDIERVKAVDETLPEQHRILPRLKARKQIELSTGLFTDNKLEDGVLVARNYRPDHIAILPDQEGACGIKHGCGVHNAFSPAARQAALLARQRSRKARDKDAEGNHDYDGESRKARIASKKAHGATNEGLPDAHEKHIKAAARHAKAAAHHGDEAHAALTPQMRDKANALAKQHGEAAAAHKAAAKAHKPTNNVFSAAAKLARKLMGFSQSTGSGKQPRRKAGKDAFDRSKKPKDAKAKKTLRVNSEPCNCKPTTNQETVTMPSKLEELTANCKGMSDEQIQRIIDNVSKPPAKPMTDAEWLASAPPGVQVAVNNAMAVVNDERKACIAKLVGNAENKEALTAVYEKMDLPALRTLAAQVQVQVATPIRNNFAGAAPVVPANNRAAGDVDEKDILPLPTMNWGQTA